MSRDQGVGMFPQLLGVSQFLENHPAVTDVTFYDKAGATKSAVAKWEAQNHPYRLPEDLSSFLSISDGLLLKWSVLFDGTRVKGLGNTHINSLGQLVHHEDPTVPEGKVAFVLDNSPSVSGRVCLVYDKASQASPATHPSVWFQSLACSWHFVAKTFTDYFRLLILHLGLPGWCHAYTDTGVPHATQEWFGFLNPERCQVDCTRGTRRDSPKKPPLLDLDRVAAILDKGGALPADAAVSVPQAQSAQSDKERATPVAAALSGRKRQAASAAVRANSDYA